MMNKKIIFLIAGLVVLLFLASVSTKQSVTSPIKEGYIPQKDGSSSLLFVGDIMLGRYVEKAMKEKGEDYPFGEGIDELFSAHTTIANLEGPIPKKHVTTPINGFQFSFTTSTAALLKRHNIEAVSLANNHANDWGNDGYENTKKILDENMIAHFGAYHTTTSDYFETKLGTTTMIIYGINMISSSWNETKAIEVTKKLRNEHKGAYLISFMHWGNEYDHAQGNAQRELAHKLIDNGVDLIIGGHPHVVQGIEIYKGSAIFYSLGNFIFDQYFSQETQEGYMVSLSVEGNTTLFTIIPTISDLSRVSVATSTRKEAVLKTVMENSSNPLKETELLNGTFSLPLQK